MDKFFVTFGSQYSVEPHPTHRTIHPDGYLTVEAETEMSARRLLANTFADKWSMVYTRDEFFKSPEDVSRWYPRGEIGQLHSDGMLELHGYRVLKALTDEEKEAVQVRVGWRADSMTDPWDALETFMEEVLMDAESEFEGNVYVGGAFMADKLRAAILDGKLSESDLRKRHR
jgi:hypothetical protein